MNGWLKSRQILPEEAQYVLVYNGRNVPLVMQFFIRDETNASKMWFQQTLIFEGDGNEGGTSFGLADYPYWQPLPAPPEDVG